MIQDIAPLLITTNTNLLPRIKTALSLHTKRQYTSSRQEWDADITFHVSGLERKDR